MREKISNTVKYKEGLEKLPSIIKEHGFKEL